MSEVKKIKPSLSKGTRDFLPAEVAKRNYIFDTIKGVLRKYGFEEIETPAIERLETLTGKYGEEGDKLLFKILNSGDYLTEIRNSKFEIRNLDAKEITPLIAEKGLRYDLTVPLARYVVQHQEDLAFPFKRFHIGPVWRADRPQKGRYQEFYQCDADVIGSTSLVNEAELVVIYLEVFEKLGVDVTVKFNHRGNLKALADIAKMDVTKFCTILDKADKITLNGVFEEYNQEGMPIDIQEKLHAFFSHANAHQMDALHNMFTDGWKYGSDFIHKDGARAMLDSMKVEEYIASITKEIRHKVQFDITLARGLNYYTGLILEIKMNEVPIGSLGGGGRYDNLTEMFGGQNMSGVGISFGIERIYDVMEELNLFPETISQGVKVLFVPRDASAEEFAFQQTQTLRDAGIPAEIFLGNVKKQKQFNYAEQKNISYIVEVGGDEITSQKFRLRNARTREMQSDLSIQDIIGILQRG